MKKKISPINNEELVKNNIGLVYQVVNKIKVSSFDRDDLIQAGLMGLFSASKGFDSTRGYAFSTYAMPFIVGNIKRELQQDRIIKISNYFLPLINFIKKETLSLSYQEMAIKYGTTIENVAIACGHASGVVSIDKIGIDYHSEGIISKGISSSNGISVPLLNNVIDFSILSSIEQKLITLRFYENLSQIEIANKFQWSQSTVSRKLKNIINKLKG